jgi:hypothetical protein
VPRELRDQLESVLRGWNAYEIRRGAAPVIDYDLRPDITEAVPIGSRLEAYERCHDVLVGAEKADDPYVADRARADASYLGALLGIRLPIEDYIRATQGCEAVEWPAEYLSVRRKQARTALEDLGITWGPSTTDELRELGGPISPEQAALEIRTAAETYEPLVRAATGATAPFNLSIETVAVDAYWHYWIDGAGSDVRLRLNVARARFTRVRSRQFALHEVLGHGLQSASIARHSVDHDVPWVRLFSVHAPQQTLLEGLAQALPLTIAPEDELLIACVRLDHYLQLVRANLHLAINRADSVSSCVQYARDHAPFWTNEEISDVLTDRTVNPLLRSYLWSYAAGMDWFVNLFENGRATSAILQAAYQEPLRPVDLTRLWADGPSLVADHPA